MYRVEPIIYRRAQKGRFPFVDTTDGNYLSHLLYEAGKKEGVPKMSIGVLGYKHIEDTKRCVESVLRFVGDIDYELILIDNGSEDQNETLNYYQSVPTMRKKIIQVEEALGPDYGCMLGTRLMYEYSEGDILVALSNDHIITENALQNMLICLESSADIGVVTPMSSNAWMCQNPRLQYSSMEEMFEVAKAFNHSDPKKWKERMITATVASAFKREALALTGFYGYWSAEAELLFKIRQAGYKVMLLGDTWVCHNHDYATKTDTHAWTQDKLKDRRMTELDEARRGGLKLFGDIMTFEYQLMSLLEKPTVEIPKLFAINVTAGQTLLDLKNRLRELDVFQTEASAFTTEARYYGLLATAAKTVYCDRIQFLREDLEGQQFDVVLLGEPVNLFPDPENLMKTILELLAPDGQLLFKMKNTCDAKMLQGLLGNPVAAGDEKLIVMTLEDVKNMASKYGAASMKARRTIGNYDAKTVETVANILSNTKAVKNVQEAVQDVLTTEYLFCVRKG